MLLLLWLLLVVSWFLLRQSSYPFPPTSTNINHFHYPTNPPTHAAPCLPFPAPREKEHPIMQLPTNNWRALALGRCRGEKPPERRTRIMHGKPENVSCCSTYYVCFFSKHVFWIFLRFDSILVLKGCLFAHVMNVCVGRRIQVSSKDWLVVEKSMQLLSYNPYAANHSCKILLRQNVWNIYTKSSHASNCGRSWKILESHHFLMLFCIITNIKPFFWVFRVLLTAQRPKGRKESGNLRNGNRRVEHFFLAPTLITLLILDLVLTLSQWLFS